MAATTMKEAKISIKVYVDKVKKRVVYAEADHTFVDVLFSFMTLPMGKIVRLFGKLADKNFNSLGSLNNLYQSLKDLPEFYFATEECKFTLLNPRSVSYDHCRYLKLKIDDTEPMKYYTCGRCFSKNKIRQFFSICNKAKCSRCDILMDSLSTYYPNVSVGDGVFVSDNATFIVTDDFSVMPYTSESIFQLLTDAGITDVRRLEERNLDMDREQMLYLLKMALSLNSPFTHFVFHSNIPVQDLACSCQATTFDHCDLAKNETSMVGEILLKVSLQKSTGKFLFAEAKENFADFVFGILSIPLGTIIGTLMNETSLFSCMDNLFKSISHLSLQGYLKSLDVKDMLVKPHFGQDYSSIYQIFSIKYAIMPRKLDGLNYEPKDPRINGVFLKQSALFFVTNDLVITPASSHLAMNTMEMLNVSFDDVEKIDIGIGLEEGIRMLKASLLTTSTLTTSLEHLLKK